MDIQLKLEELEARISQVKSDLPNQGSQVTELLFRETGRQLRSLAATYRQIQKIVIPSFISFPDKVYWGRPYKNTNSLPPVWHESTNQVNIVGTKLYFNNGSEWIEI